MFNSQLDKLKIEKYLIDNKQVLSNGCWILKHQKGKSYHYYEGVGIHRLSLWLYKDFDISSKLFALHRCDNPPCWNPEHLFPGDQSKNQKDSFKKGRRPRIFGRVLDQINTTHCPKGHEYTSENTKYIGIAHKRGCKICIREKDKLRNKGTKMIKGKRYRVSQLKKMGLLK